MRKLFNGTEMMRSAILWHKITGTLVTSWNAEIVVNCLTPPGW